MALRFCSNWPSLDNAHHHLHQQDDFVDQFADTLMDLPIDIDPLFDALSDYFSSSDPASSTLLHSFSEPSFPPEPTPPALPEDDDDAYPLHCPPAPWPKRAKSFDDLYFNRVPSGDNFMLCVDPLGVPAAVDGGATTMMMTTMTMGGASDQQQFGNFPLTPEFLLPHMSLQGTSARFPAVMEFSCGGGGEAERKGSGVGLVGGRSGGGGSPSAQSVAARERRKRISDKTQELGKLIPGGNKMNTAEMFQAAHSYVKFLQAQVGMLSLVGTATSQETTGSPPHQLEALLASTAVQEKLSRSGKCLVPIHLVEELADDNAIKSHPSISKDLGRLMEPSGDQEPSSINKGS